MNSALPYDVIDELRQSVRGVLRRVADTRAPQSDAWAPAPIDDQLWKQAGALGWTGLLANEQWGGSEAGLSATVAVVEELAGELATVPYIASAVLAVSAFELGGNDEQRACWLPDVVAGTTVAAVAVTGPTGRIAIDMIDVRAEADPAGWVLHGHAGFVLNAADAELLVIAARVDTDVAMFAVSAKSDGVRVVERLAVDRTRRLADVVLDGVRVPTDHRLAQSDAKTIEALAARGGLVVAADACGVGRRALDVSVEYAKQREQFGRPIGSFQAIKHKLADMWVLMQGAEVAIEAAARAIDEGDPRAARLTAVASAYARDAATKVTGDAIQVHGGIGYTWEHVCHALWKRAKFDEVYLGDPSVHRAHLAHLLLAR